MHLIIKYTDKSNVT